MTTRREFLAWTGKIAIGGMAGLAVLEACEPTSFPSAASNSVTPPPPGPDGRIGIDVSDLTSSNPAKMAPGLTGPDGMPVMVTLPEERATTRCRCYARMPRVRSIQKLRTV